MVIATPTKSKVKLATEQMANPSMKLPDTSLAAPTMIGEMNIPKAGEGSTHPVIPAQAGIYRPRAATWGNRRD